MKDVVLSPNIISVSDADEENIKKDILAQEQEKMAEKQEKLFRIFVPYQYLKGLAQKKRQALFDDCSAEFCTFIAPEEKNKLSAEELQNYADFTLLESEPLHITVPKVKPEDLFLDEAKPPIMAPTYKEKHCPQMHPYVPRKIINPHFNSRKKGGR